MSTIADVEEYVRQARRDGVARGLAFPLLPRHGVWLFAPDGGGERFATLFQETWARIPLGPRRAIVRHWRSGPFAYPKPFGPEVGLMSGWSGRSGGRGLRGDKARTTRAGHTLTFWTKIVAAYPDDLVRDLIAHELAHVFQCADGWNIGAMPPLEVEEDADWHVERWGFSADAIDVWYREHGVTRVLDPATMSKAALARYWKQVEQNGR